MCHNSCLEFGRKYLTPALCSGKDILEVGSYNVNGSLRPFALSHGPHKYIGVDITLGPGVDHRCSADNLVSFFGKNHFDLVISTELLEHVPDWRKAISNIKNVCKHEGFVLITTRSPGFPYHPYPIDMWRFTLEDIKFIFSDFIIQTAEMDSQVPGVFILSQKPLDFNELSLLDYSIQRINFDQLKPMEKYHTLLSNLQNNQRN